MPQQTSPFIEMKYGWNLGESGWNTGMDENLVKLSFLIDSNIDGIVSTLPTSPPNGSAYFLTTDNRLYYRVSSTYYFSPTPTNFILKLKSDGTMYKFNGTSLSVVKDLSDTDFLKLQGIQTGATKNSNTDELAEGTTNKYFTQARVMLTPVTSLTLTPIKVAISDTLTTTVGKLQGQIESIAVTPIMYGAVGDGVADDTTFVQAALDASLKVDLGDYTKTYKISNTLTLRNGHRVTGSGATVKHSVQQKPMWDITNKKDIIIRGGVFIGIKESPYVNSASSQAICITASGSDNCLITENKFVDWCYSPLMAATTANKISFISNEVIGPGATVLSDINYRNTTGVTLIGTNNIVALNKITQSATGVIIGQGSIGCSVVNNDIFDTVNEHGVYVDTGVKDIVLNSNNIRNTGAAGTGIKVQCYDSFGLTPTNISIVGNSIRNTGTDSILIINVTAGTPTIKTQGVTVSANSIVNSGQSGISVRSVDNCTVVGNSIYGAASDGIFLLYADNTAIASNNLYNIVTCGIFDGGSNVGVKISGNTLRNVGQGASPPANCAIYNNSGSYKTISDNTINSVSAAYGVFIADGDQSTMTVTGNQVFGGTTASFRFKSPASPLALFSQNIFTGTIINLNEALQRGELPYHWFGTAAPTTGTWVQGARVENLYPVAGGVAGWVCVVAGSPGTWKTYGNVAA